jgi:hypothetical protein
MGLFHQFIPVFGATAANIRNFMDANDLDHRAFAALAGVDPSTVKRITTSNRCEIRSDTRQKLTRAIGCTWLQLCEPDFISRSPSVPPAPGTANLPIGAVQHDLDFPEEQLNPHPVLLRASAPPREPEVLLAFPTCRRVPLATWLLYSWRAWRECFTWRAALRALAPQRRLTSAAARFTRAEMRAAYHAEFIAPQETPHA